MKLFEVNYGIWANPTLIIITANNKREARKIAKPMHSKPKPFLIHGKPLNVALLLSSQARWIPADKAIAQ